MLRLANREKASEQERSVVKLASPAHCYPKLSTWPYQIGYVTAA